MESEPGFLRELLASPYGKARVREYYRAWLRVTWVQFRLIERRGGLVLSFVLGAAVVASDGLISGTAPRSMRALLALLGGLAIATLCGFVVAFIRAPSRLALWQEFEEDETVDSYCEFGHLGLDRSGPPVLRFVTRNMKDRALPVDSAGKTQVRALRFTGSVNQVVHRSELPVVLKLRRLRGRIVVKAFDGCTVLLGEERTSGAMIHAEVYYADEGQHSARSSA